MRNRLRSTLSACIAVAIGIGFPALLATGLTSTAKAERGRCDARLTLAAHHSVDFKAFCSPVKGFHLGLTTIRSDLPMTHVSRHPLVDGARGGLRCVLKGEQVASCRKVTRSDGSSVIDDTKGHVLEGRLKVRGDRCRVSAQFTYSGGRICDPGSFCTQDAVVASTGPVTPRGC